MFVGAAAPVSAANYAFSPDLTQPTLLGGGLAAMNIVDVAQSGTTMYTITSTAMLYKSLDGGATWFPANLALAGTPGILAVAPDDAAIVAYVDTAAMRVYLSNNGGITFGILTASGVNTAVINAIAISPLTVAHYIAIGGSNAGATVSGVEYWTMGVAAPVWAALAPPTGIDYTNALTFSTNFAADACLLVAGTDDSTGARGLFVDTYSFNLLAWNPLGYGFPRTYVATVAAATVTARVQIVLDANFYVGDVTTQVGFIAADITAAAVQVGGIFRMDTTKITSSAPSVAYNSVAWDGTNLMAGVRAAGPVTVVRCSNALAVAGWVFIPNSPLKTPGTGTLPLVVFNGANGYCFSTGTNNAVAKTTDLGKTFTGTTLVNSNFGIISDYWVSPDGAVTYVLADDGTDMNLWKKDGTVWTRQAIIAGGAGAAWMVRADKDAPATVYMGLKGATNLLKSVDGGVTWITRAASANIVDFVVQDANTVFVAVNGPNRVVKSVNGAFTWTPTFPVIAGACYSLNLIADNQLILGSTAGSVAYTTDVVTWTTIPVAMGTGGVVATASGLATGDTIWAGDNVAVAATWADFGAWVIGTNTALTGWTPYLGTLIGTVDGIAYANGVLYVMDNTGLLVPPVTIPVTPASAPALYRFLYPTITVAVSTDNNITGLNVVAGTTINSLQYTTGSTNIVIRAAAGVDTMQSYTDKIIGASMAPVPTYPVNDAIIGVNSIAGGVNAFNFMWTAPLAGSVGGYRFDIQVFMDELGIVPASALGAAVSPVFFDGATGNQLSTTLAGFAPVAGETYYWHVRVSTGFPVQSFWSPMQTFSVQQLQAVVPEIGSPQNGSTIEPSAAAFSWTPIAGAASYKFELDTGATFAAPLYSATVTSAGASLPATITLERGRTYFWRVKTLTPAEGEWSTVGNFMVAELVVTSTPVTTTVTPVTTVQTTITIPAATTTVITIPPVVNTTTEVNPPYIWAIIIIGAVLVLAVIVLIVRTRRSV